MCCSLSSAQMNQPGEPTKPSGRKRFRSTGWSRQMSPQNTSWIPAKKVKKKYIQSEHRISGDPYQQTEALDCVRCCCCVCWLLVVQTGLRTSGSVSHSGMTTGSSSRYVACFRLLSGHVSDSGSFSSSSFPSSSSSPSSEFSSSSSALTSRADRTAPICRANQGNASESEPCEVV